MPITILLTDDSEVIRFLFTKALERDPDLKVVATAASGIEAIEQAKKFKPDIVLLDIEMPQMDGLTALPKILAASSKSKIFMISGNSRDNATAAIESLSRGASEFIQKPGSSGALKPAEFNDELRAKIKSIMGWSEGAAPAPAAAQPSPALPTLPRLKTGISVPTARPLPPAPPPVVGAALASIELKTPKKTPIKAVAIASSTGGPEALLLLFRGLRDKLLHLPIFITQHMPPLFTATLAERIAEHGGRLCKEGESGEVVRAGVAYVAPGGQHMVVRAKGGKHIIELTQDAPVNSCRPSADPMFASISHAYGANVLAVVLTGIGTDGAQGAREIEANGGSVFAQDQASSVVYGMPKAAAKLGVCEGIFPLDAMAAQIIKRCG